MFHFFLASLLLSFCPLLVLVGVNIKIKTVKLFYPCDLAPLFQFLKTWWLCFMDHPAWSQVLKRKNLPPTISSLSDLETLDQVNKLHQRLCISLMTGEKWHLFLCDIAVKVSILDQSPKRIKYCPSPPNILLQHLSFQLPLQPSIQCSIRASLLLIGGAALT